MTTAGRPAVVDVAAHDRAVLDERVRVYLEYSGPGGPTLSRSDLTALLDRLAEAEEERGALHERITFLRDRLQQTTQRCAEAEAKVDDGRCRHRWNCSDHGLDAACDCPDAGRAALTGGDR